MNLQGGLKRVYVVLAALWGVVWLALLVAAYLDGTTTTVINDLIVVGLILASPLVYLALVGLTKVVAWIVAGFKTVPPQP